jgi:hypothetical protein
MLGIIAGLASRAAANAGLASTKKPMWKFASAAASMYGHAALRPFAPHGSPSARRASTSRARLEGGVRGLARGGDRRGGRASLERRRQELERDDECHHVFHYRWKGALSSTPPAIARDRAPEVPFTLRDRSMRRQGFELPFLAAVAAWVATACGSGGEGPGYAPVDDGGSTGTAPPDAATGPADAYVTPPADGGPVDAGPQPFSFATWSPPGKGLWIWYLDYVGMTATDAAQKAADMGVGYVLMKSAQDGNFWSTRFTEANIKEFTSRGMRVFAWPYVTPAGGAAAVDAAVRAAKTPGCDGLVLDVEVEWETGSDHSAAATALCKGIRAAVPGVQLGYTSFGWVGYHAALPFAAFDADCGDAAFPQVYYSDRGVSWDGPSGISEARAMYKAAGLKAPMWAIESNDDVKGTTTGPTIADLNGFLDDVGKYASLWEFPAAPRTEKLAQLPSLHWKNAP